MIVLALLAVLVTAGLLARGGAGDRDLPARIVAVAATWLPVRLRPWGRAMAAELPHVGGSARRWRFAAGVLRVALSLAGVTAAIVTVTRIAVAHPAATTDGTHVYSVLFALLLAGYLALALPRSRLEDRARWWAVGTTLAAFAALAVPVKATGITSLLWPAAAAAVLAASIGAGAATRSARAGARAGLLTVALTAPMHVAADLTVLLRAGHFTLTTPYDIAAYPHSGYPDVASYLLSDAIAGEIIGGLVLFPLVLLVLARLGGAAGTRLRLTRA